jgi:hypothetical protein
MRIRASADLREDDLLIWQLPDSTYASSISGARLGPGTGVLTWHFYVRK